MRNFININQVPLVELGLNIQEWIILTYFASLSSWAECKIYEGKNYFRLHSSKIIEDLPILGITTKSGILKAIARLKEKGLIDRLGDECFYSLTPLAQDVLNWEGVSTRRGGYPHGEGGVSARTHNSNINYNNKNYNYIHNYNSLWENEKRDFVSQLKEEERAELLFLLSGQKENNSDLSVEELVEARNSLWHKLPKVMGEWMKKLIKVELKKINSLFSKEDVEKSILAYIEDIKSRKNTSDYFNHRFTLYAFLKQGNGLRKFIHLSTS